MVSESDGESWIVTSVGGGLPLPECLDGPLPITNPGTRRCAAVRVMRSGVGKITMGSRRAGRTRCCIGSTLVSV
jgi:hypothetical protein